MCPSLPRAAHAVASELPSEFSAPQLYTSHYITSIKILVSLDTIWFRNGVATCEL